MGIFRRAGEWLNDRYYRFVRGEGDMPGGYYASPEAEQAYGGMGAERVAAQDGGEDIDNAHRGVDPFGNGESDYGGRIPYRSRFEVERDAARSAQLQQQASYQQHAAQGQMTQGMPQQPMQSQQPIQQQPMQQPQAAQHAYQQQGYQQPSSNVVAFPGMQVSNDGSVFAHVEYIVLLRSRGECKDVIAYIKANASVFLNMEFIASDSERQRCVDMLSGAAYTLGCALNKISPRGIYLISSPSVRVVLDPAMQKFTAAPEAQGFVRQRYEGEPQRAYASEQQEAQQPVSGFSSGSPTTRFQAQGAQRMPASFGSVMAGNPAYTQSAAHTGRYATVQQ